jgi:putative DNA primase/helicase
MPPFIQRLFGYGITGQTTEHILPIMCGDGRNGKGTMMEVLGDILGSDLAISTQADAIMDVGKSGDGPKPFVYALRGKRLVWASESNEGRRINSGLVKQLTGGDRLNVRTLHSKPVEFHPTHKILLITNHKPHLSADDQALWDRVYLIAFNQRFIDRPQKANEHPRDKNLKAALLAEAPGILAWLVRGCLEWQRVGLLPPAEVLTQTEEYRAEEDTIGLFIDEKCYLSPDYKVRAAELYKAYQEWSKDSGLSAMTGTLFGKRVKKRFDSTISHGTWYIGIGLESEP